MQNIELNTERLFKSGHSQWLQSSKFPLSWGFQDNLSKSTGRHVLGKQSVNSLDFGLLTDPRTEKADSHTRNIASLNFQIMLDKGIMKIGLFVAIFLLFSGCANQAPTLSYFEGNWESTGPLHMQLTIREDGSGLFGMAADDMITCPILAIQSNNEDVSFKLNCPEIDGERIVEIKLTALNIGMEIDGIIYTTQEVDGKSIEQQIDLPWSMVFLNQEHLAQLRNQLREKINQDLEQLTLEPNVVIEHNDSSSDSVCPYFCQ